jgi:DNA polymerase-3 subunit gamma/tau
MSKSTELTSYNLPEKHRPKSLDDFVGQDATAAVVQGWVNTKRFPQTILIHGQTGSGKTTLAKILARLVNCKTFDACGKCEYCKHEVLPDVLEINAGTAGKVDEVNALIQSSKQAPRYRRRVIIVDEAHLLTDKAESNLLVPTEKPSKNTIWIFCTTDPEKMKQTMRNRCAQLAIRPIEDKILGKRLMEIAKIEGVKMKDKDAAKKAIAAIASMSEGQMRYGLSMLDSLISAVNGGKSFDEKSVMQLAATITDSDIEMYAVYTLAAVLRNNLDNVVKFVKKANDPRKTISKITYLINWIIENNLGLVPYTPAIGKTWIKLCEAQKKKDAPVIYSTASLIKIMGTLQDVDYRILTTPAFSGSTALYTALANLSIDDYFKTVQGKKNK